MKKAIIISIIIIQAIFKCEAQVEYENNWILGYGVSNNDTLYLNGGININFNQNKLNIDTFNLNTDWSIITTMSDKEGKLIFYSNGCSIRNKLGQVMENGDTLNPGAVYNQYCHNEFGVNFYPQSQLILSLPSPGKEDVYEVFHIGIDDETLYASTFYQTTIDMSKNNGLGMVGKKNVKIFTVPKLNECLSACRHGNGRDWWLVIPSFNTDTFYRVLVTPNGTKGAFVQKVGYDKSKSGYGGQSCFSPNGQWYVQSTRTVGIQLFNFDPCTGLLSNAKRFYFAPDTAGCSGVAFSPNSRYLYVTSCVQLYQYDLWVSDIEASRITIDDVVKNPKADLLSIYQAKLAPDNKIYFSALPTWPTLHVINNPDEGGKACNFEQQGIKLPRFNDWYLPNIPYFRLYDQPGSPCDTLGIDAPVSTYEDTDKTEAKVYPNPNTGQFTLSSDQDAEFNISDLNGGIILVGMIQKGDVKELDVQSQPNGFYLIRLNYNDGSYKIVKLMKL